MRHDEITLGRLIACQFYLSRVCKMPPLPSFSRPPIRSVLGFHFVGCFVLARLLHSPTARPPNRLSILSLASPYNAAPPLVPIPTGTIETYCTKSFKNKARAISETFSSRSMRSANVMRCRENTGDTGWCWDKAIKRLNVWKCQRTNYREISSKANICICRKG
jgi:hypothetical protein